MTLALGLVVGFLVGFLTASLCRAAAAREAAGERVLRESRRASTYREIRPENWKGYQPRPLPGGVKPTPPQGGSGIQYPRARAKRQKAVKHGR